MGIEEDIRRTALSLGFDLVGITSADCLDGRQIEQFKEWLHAGCNGQMTYLAKNADKRFSSGSVLAGAKSVICAAINYKINSRTEKDSLQIASYALYPDYHKFIKEKLQELAGFLKSREENVKFKICVDSSPIAEKALAMRAGLGFIGKNRLLTNLKLGSFLLFGEIITDLQLKPDEPIKRQLCGNCKKCIETCPTGALSDNGFDARKCISYLTIEHNGEISPELKEKIGLHLFGCDECLRVCPYNEKSPLCEKQQFGFSAREIKIRPDEIIGWTEKNFENFAADSAMLRTGFDKIKRNALICRGLQGRR